MVDNTRRKILKLLGAAGAATTVGGTGIAAAQQGDGIGKMMKMANNLGTARVRVGHLSPDAPPVDVYAFIPGMRSAGEVSVFTNLRFPQVQPNIPANYTDVPTIPLGFRITPAGKKDKTLFRIKRVKPEAGRNYTLLAVGEADPELSQPEARPLVLVDNENERPPTYGRSMLPAPDETLVRIVHAETEVGKLTARSGSQTLGSLRFGEATDYQAVDPDKDLRLRGPRRSGSGPGLDKTITGGLHPGHAYSIYVVEERPETGGFKPMATATTDAVARVRLQTDG